MAAAAVFCKIKPRLLLTCFNRFANSKIVWKAPAFNVHRLNYAPQWTSKLRLFCSQECLKLDIVDYCQVKRTLQDPTKLVIDVRRHDELENTGHMPGSLNIPLHCLEDVLIPSACNTKLFSSTYGREKPSIETEMVFSCRTGKRAKEAASKAIAMGYKNVKWYQGSWSDWEKNAE